MIWIFSLVANVTYWVLLFFGQDELDRRMWWVLALAWPVIWVVFRMIPDGFFIDMAIVAIIDIYLLFAVLGGDAAKV
jgi:hypothetical protein